MQKNNKYKQRGFTLIELMLVVSIIVLLSSVIFASTSIARAKALDVRRVAEVNQIKNALELYKTTHGSYPPQNYFNDGDHSINDACFAPNGDPNASCGNNTWYPVPSRYIPEFPNSNSSRAFRSTIQRLIDDRLISAVYEVDGIGYGYFHDSQQGIAYVLTDLTTVQNTIFTGNSCPIKPFEVVTYGTNEGAIDLDYACDSSGFSAEEAAYCRTYFFNRDNPETIELAFERTFNVDLECEYDPEGILSSTPCKITHSGSNYFYVGSTFYPFASDYNDMAGIPMVAPSSIAPFFNNPCSVLNAGQYCSCTQ